ncbi:MAG: RNA polymerase sigma factor [Beutenbergiaceae bacterium]
MSEIAGQLQQALAAGDSLAARKVLTEAASDADLLHCLAQQAAQGSPLATELLIERLDASGMVRAFAAGVLLDRAAVDDVSQDALISIAESIGSFAGTAKLSTWVHAIVRRRVVDHLRRLRDTAPLPPDDLAPSVRMSSAIATRATVRQALAQLPELYREPVELRDIEGLRYDDIAARLGRSVAAIKSQIGRGRAMIAGTLRQLEHDR